MRIKVQTRIVLLISLLMGVSVFVLFAAKQEGLRRMDRLYRTLGKENDLFFDRILRLNSRPLEIFVSDYTFWDDMVAFVQRGDRRWADDTLATALVNYEADALWVYRTDFSLAYSTNVLAAAGLTRLPVPQRAYPRLFTGARFCHFFVVLPQGMMEIFGATVHPTADAARKTAPLGYFFAGRLWTKASLLALEKITDSSINIVFSEKKSIISIADFGNDIISFSKLLPGWNGKPIARFNIKTNSLTLGENRRTKTIEFFSLLFFECIVVLLLAWCLFRWVSRPLNAISRGLDTDNPAPIRPLLKEKTEFGHIAEMMTRFFAQKQELLTEIAERKHTEAQLAKTQQELLDAKRLSDIGMLAATVAHELRNPLAVIRIASYNIQRKFNDKGLEKHIAHIDRKIVEADQIIKNLLYYSRLRMPQYGMVTIADLLDECMESVRCRFSGWDVTVVARYGSSRSLQIEADRLQLTELFSNLLANAYESFPARTGAIEVKTWSYRHTVTVSVQDNGCGIDEDKQANLFEPFFTTKPSGTGLGLTICHQIVNLHRGSITVKSRQDEGTTFTVNLPLKKTPELQ
jgi:signal transduction histidine kinase